MYGSIQRTAGYANGIFLAYWVKLTLIAYAIAHHEYGFAVPTSWSEVTQLIQSL